MKYLLILFFAMSLMACNRGDKQAAPVMDTKPVKAEQGGVDVGNLTTAIVPQTNALLTYPSSWKGESSKQSLILHNASGSKIEARKSEIREVSSPTALGLQQYLKAKHPDRNYQLLQVNGMEGVRADLVETDQEKKSDIYLISELKDFIHIESDLKGANNGISAGDKIISTVKVKYQGVPYEKTEVKTIILEARSGLSERYAYTFQNDCFSYSDPGCRSQRGVAVAYEGEFSVGTAGYDHGRVIELGPESQIPFESIKVEGDYLVAPISNILISDIYTAFQPKNPKKDQGRVQLKEGHVYLVRTISWPDEDLITKMKVEKLEEGKRATITYQKLAYVKKEVLQKQVDAINKSTIENEQPLNEGEVTLYNRSFWGNYHFASFNFEYSTSGNMFITRNSFDFEFSGADREGPQFSSTHSGGALGQVTDIGVKDLDQLTMGDFPDPNMEKSDSRVRVKTGNTYLVYNFRYSDDDKAFVYGAVKVLDIGPQNEWVRLKFRRIKLAPATHFQKWIDLAIPTGVHTVTLEKSEKPTTSVFHPFINKRGDMGSHYYESVRLSIYDGNKDSLSTDSRPYGNARGFSLLPSGISLNTVSAKDVEALKGKFSSTIAFKKGEVYAVLLENFYDKTVMLMQIGDVVPGQSVTISYRYLLRAKTPYSDDKE